MVTTNFAYFLNSMLNFAFFTFKAGITHLYNSSKMMHLFILLSNQLVPISNTIFEGDRSFDPTSTASRLMFAHLSTTTLPLSTPLLSQQAGHEPLPSVEGCGLIFQHLSGLEGQAHPSPAPPFPEGYGWVILARRWKWGVGNTRGDPRSGRPA